ncbi:MAG: hypothetical protein ACI823_001015, partial [Chitinophagales bacterium]
PAGDIPAWVSSGEPMIIDQQQVSLNLTKFGRFA